MHLDDPSATIERMASALRADGVLFVEDPDSFTTGPVDPAHPRAAVAQRVLASIRGGIANRAIFDPTLGRRLPRLLERAGLRHVQNECHTGIVRAPSIRSTLALKTMSMFRDLALEEGVSEADWHSFIAAYEDPTYEMVTMMTVQAWGWR
jgi:hypothetical protein